MVLTFESVDENICCYHSSETSSAVLSQRAICSVLQNEISPTKKIEYIEDDKVVCEQPLVNLGEGGKDREGKATGGGLKRQKIQVRPAEKTVVSRRLKIDLHPSSFFIKLVRCRHSNF